MGRKKIQTKSKFLNWVLDWVDAILFAVVVVTFVNLLFFQSFKIPSSSMEKTLYTGDRLFVGKMAFGARMPQTPLTIPFTHNVIFGKESYSTSVQWKYRRLPGFRKVRRGDNVVFNFPNGDTVLVNSPSTDYHYLVRLYGRESVLSSQDIVVRPMDKKDNYVKRCVAVAGDTLEVREGLVWVNGQQQTVWPGVQMYYRVTTKAGGYDACFTAEQYNKVKSSPNVLSVEPLLERNRTTASSKDIFPFTEDSSWTRDFFGPLWIPKKGVTVDLTAQNLPLYERIISVYEHGDLAAAMEEGKYTFKQDYYFMMGDNRHNSLDSRYWGFVPEDHVVGRPALVWLSTDSEKKFPNNIRWNRFFKFL